MNNNEQTTLVTTAFSILVLVALALCSGCSHHRYTYNTVDYESSGNGGGVYRPVYSSEER